MRSKVAARILARTPEDVKVFVKMNADLIVLINSVIKEKGFNQKMLAEKLDKSPSEIHKWLSGEHNFTLRSIAKLQAELGVNLLEIPTINKPASKFRTYNGKTTFKVYSNVTLEKTKVVQWTEPSFNPNKKLIVNVG
jgi:ribosome-binding protein aMBF1 (putative translation factor)